MINNLFNSLLNSFTLLAEAAATTDTAQEVEGAVNAAADAVQQIQIDAPVVASTWPSGLIYALMAALAAVSIFMIVIILLQKKRASGIGAALAGTGETYWSKNKGKSAEGALEKYTKWGGFAFILIALLINIFVS